MNPTKRTTISTIISIGYGIVLFAIVGFAWTFGHSMRQLQAITRDLYYHPFVVSNAAADMKTTVYQLRDAKLQLIMFQNSPGEFAGLLRQIDSDESRTRADLKVIASSFLGDQRQVRLLGQNLDRWHEISARMIAACLRGDSSGERLLLVSNGTPIFAQMVPLLDYIQNFARIRAQGFVQQADRDSAHTIRQEYLLMLLMLNVVLATAVIVYWRVRFLQHELDRLASYDYLTGIANRRHFMNLLERELRRAQRYHEQFSLVLIDLDWFKSINDRYGHPVGDRVLQRFCLVCQHNLRESDLLGRVGGEEFAMLLHNTGQAEAMTLIERIRHALEQEAIALDGGEILHVTASFGVSAVAAETLRLEQLLHQADRALYQAKAAGRNCVIAC
jgi:diguanylate cyclase (GGDEF)-like protein